jgi:hypothetical protein
MLREKADQKTTILSKTYPGGRATEPASDRRAFRKEENNLLALIRFYGSKFLLQYSMLKLKSRLKQIACKAQSPGTPNRKVHSGNLKIA